MKNSKKGNSMVEATIVLPIIIITLIAIICIIISMYKNVETSVASHIAILNKAQILSETGEYYGNISNKIELSTTNELFFYKVEGEKTVPIYNNMFFYTQNEKNISNYCKVANEKFYIRCCDFT